MVCDDLSEQEYAAVSAHVNECPCCREYVQQVSNPSETITKEYPQLSKLKERYAPSPIEGNKQRAKKPFILWSPFRGTLAVGLSFVLCIVFLFQINKNEPEPLAIKGNTTWFLFANDSLYSQNADTVWLQSGDQMQLLARINKATYYHVFYRDDSGPMHRYCCDEPTLLEPSEAGAMVSLPFSIELDTLWQRQAIYCLSSNVSFDATRGFKAISRSQTAEPDTAIAIQPFYLFNRGTK